MDGLFNQWNKEHARVKDGTTPSAYAIEVEKLFPRQSIICDLGGGQGRDSVYFAQHGHTVNLLDISDLALNNAQKTVNSLNLKNKIIIKQINLVTDNLPLENNSIDILYSRLALHYFNLKRTQQILEEVYRVLKPNGKAFLTIKSPEDKNEMSYLNNTSTKLEEFVYLDEGIPKSRYPKKMWEEMLKKANVGNFIISSYEENFDNRTDLPKSGNEKLSVYQIIINKS